MRFDLVTPERQVLSTEATMVVVPGVEGEMGILPGHAPLISLLRDGVVTAHLADGSVQTFQVSGGTVDVTPQSCAVLAEQASVV